MVIYDEYGKVDLLEAYDQKFTDLKKEIDQLKIENQAIRKLTYTIDKNTESFKINTALDMFEIRRRVEILEKQTIVSIQEFFRKVKEKFIHIKRNEKDPT